MPNRKKILNAMRLITHRSISQLGLAVLPSHRISYQQKAHCLRSVTQQEIGHIRHHLFPDHERTADAGSAHNTQVLSVHIISLYAYVFPCPPSKLTVFFSPEMQSSIPVTDKGTTWPYRAEVFKHVYVSKHLQPPTLLGCKLWT